MNVHIREDVPLAPLTSLELGGRARYFVQATDEAILVEALRWANARGVPTVILGGGTNTIVPDEGFDGLVLHMTMRGRRIDRGHTVSQADVSVAAGEPWDEFVGWAVDNDLAGIECLSGIPGTAGATPIQNVGAYGQEVAETINGVRCIDPRSLAERTFDPSECDFSYRDSVFKRDIERWVVVEVRFRLRPQGEPTIKYPELSRALSRRSPTLSETRQAVLTLRRRKSMVLDPDDANRRSAGSFFLNPVVSEERAREVVEKALSLELVDDPVAVPIHRTAGRAKISAGWLIEQSGLTKGTRRAHVGISDRHALALVHHGGGTTAELLEFAREVQERVRERFGVLLVREPRLLGDSKRNV